MDLGTVKNIRKRSGFIFNAVSDPAGRQVNKAKKCGYKSQNADPNISIIAACSISCRVGSMRSRSSPELSLYIYKCIRLVAYICVYIKICCISRDDVYSAVRKTICPPHGRSGFHRARGLRRNL